MKQYFKNGAVVLFQGDSITDCGRTGENGPVMGYGYPVKIKQIYEAMFPNADVTFVNRAVSGNRVRDLLIRYEKDFVAVKPDFISILIGVNDSWRSEDGDPCPIERFTQEYDELLGKIKTDLPNTQVMLLTPFLLHSDPNKLKWEDDLKEKIKAVKALSEKYDCILFDYEAVLWNVVRSGEYTGEMLSGDGVHPSDFGQSLLAIEYLKRLGIIA